MHRFVVAFATVLVLAVFAACGNDNDIALPPCGTNTPGPSYINAPAITFGAISQALRVEIADSASERGRGLMNRTCLGDDWGMLFVYPEEVQDTFWMKNTLVPLSIAWVDADGTILEIEDMQPETEDQHSAPAPYRYAIEANQGWFAEHGIEAGDRAAIPPNLSAS